MARRALTRRERNLVAAAAMIFFSMIFLPAGRILAREYRVTQEQLAAAKDGLRQARALREAVLEQRKGAELIAERVREGSGDFLLFNYARSVIDQHRLTERAKIDQRVSLPKLNVVAIELKGISLEELIGLMSALQDGKHLVSLETLNSLEAARDRKGLDCSLSLVSPRA